MRTYYKKKEKKEKEENSGEIHEIGENAQLIYLVRVIDFSNHGTLLLVYVCPSPKETDFSGHMDLKSQKWLLALSRAMLIEVREFRRTAAEERVQGARLCSQCWGNTGRRCRAVREIAWTLSLNGGTAMSAGPPHQAGTQENHGPVYQIKEVKLGKRLEVFFLQRTYTNDQLRIWKGL